MNKCRLNNKMLDSNEIAVINALLYDARKKATEIAKETNLSRQTVTNIIKKLEDNGKIWGYSTVFEPEVTGDHFFLVLMKFKVDVDVRELMKKVLDTGVMKELTKDKFRYSTLMFGRFDFLTSFYAPDIIEANKIVNKVLKPFRKHLSEVYIHESIITFRRMGIINPHVMEKIETLF
jgi:DNA-binding Lrp family transcriptional regulator